MTAGNFVGLVRVTLFRVTMTVGNFVDLVALFRVTMTAGNFVGTVAICRVTMTAGNMLTVLQ